MKALAVRRLFVAAMFVLPIQYALVGLIGLRWSEPWPALVMPSFQQVYDPTHIEAQSTSFEAWFRDGGSETISSMQLLESLPRSHQGVILRKHFAVPSPDNSLYAPSAQPEMQAWLKKRLIEIFPGRVPVRVDAIWWLVAFESDGSETRIRSQPVDTMRIALP